MVFWIGGGWTTLSLVVFMMFNQVLKVGVYVLTGLFILMTVILNADRNESILVFRLSVAR